MNKQLYNFCQTNFRERKSDFIVYKAMAKKLFREYNFGSNSAQKLYFTESDIEQLVRRVKEELNLDLFKDKFEEQVNRVHRSKVDPLEKRNTVSVRSEYVLLNSITSININGNKNPIIAEGSLGNYVAIEDIKSIENTHLILVENLIVMGYLSALNLSADFKNALWVYRGDKNAENTTGVAYQFFRLYQGKIKTICFSDYDPEGVNIAISSGADEWLTLIDPINCNLSSYLDNDFHKQTKACTSLRLNKNLPIKCQQAFENMSKTKTTIKQEHMVSHQLALGCFSLNKKESI